MALKLKNLLPGLFSQTVDLGGGVTVDNSGNMVVPGNLTVQGTSFSDTGAQTITSVSASALAVGRQGATNPVLQVDASVASNVNGLSIKGQASGSGVQLSTISSANNDSLNIDSKGSSNIALNANGGTGVIYLGQNLQFADPANIVIGTTTGTQIGTGATQKIGFYGATPVVQPAASADITGFAAGVGTASKSDSTWTGATGSSAYTVGGIVTRLKALGLLAT